MMHTRAVAFAIGLGLHTGADIVVPALKKTYAMSPEHFSIENGDLCLTETFAGERYELQFFVPGMKGEDGKLFQ